MENRKQLDGGGEESEEDKWVHDASVDYRGRVPLRAFTGVWKASLFILSKIPFSLQFFTFLLNIIFLKGLQPLLDEKSFYSFKNVHFYAPLSS